MLLYTFASTWLGVLFLFLSTLVVLEPARPFVHINTPLVGRCVVAFVAVLSIFGLINALFIRVTEVNLPVAGLEKPVRAVLLSDLHVGTIHNSGFLKRIVSKTNNLQPDVVFITGDFFDGTGPITEKTVLPLSGLQAPSFFVMGNHEKFFGMDRVQGLIEPTGVRVLRNTVVQFRDLQIIGIDNPERENRKDNEQIHNVAFDRSRPNVLLYHTPVGIEDARRAGVIDTAFRPHAQRPAVSLQPAGKTVLPLHARLFMTFDGLAAALALYVTPGTGPGARPCAWAPAMRLR